jgi:hypothetical protein
MKVSADVRFRSPLARVYDHVAWSVFAHAIGEPPQHALLRSRLTLLTRYKTKLWRWTVVTTREASLAPDERITWRHVNGPLTGSEEVYALSETEDGGTRVRCTGDIRARSRWLRGPVERLILAPMAKRAAEAALEQAKREVDGG